MNSTTDIGENFKSVLLEERCNMLAATSVMAKHGNGPALVQIAQMGRYGLHGNVNKFKALGLNLCRFKFPILTDINQENCCRWSAVLFNPLRKGLRANLFNHLPGAT